MCDSLTRFGINHVHTGNAARICHQLPQILVARQNVGIHHHSILCSIVAVGRPIGKSRNNVVCLVSRGLDLNHTQGRRQVPHQIKLGCQINGHGGTVRLVVGIQFLTKRLFLFGIKYQHYPWHLFGISVRVKLTVGQLGVDNQLIQRGTNSMKSPRWRAIASVHGNAGVIRTEYQRRCIHQQESVGFNFVVAGTVDRFQGGGHLFGCRPHHFGRRLGQGPLLFQILLLFLSFQQGSQLAMFEHQLRHSIARGHRIQIILGSAHGGIAKDGQSHLLGRVEIEFFSLVLLINSLDDEFHLPVQFVNGQVVGVWFFWFLFWERATSRCFGQRRGRAGLGLVCISLGRLG
mmetsp:Transcript_6936/g.19451  ORF Transcript_6936/g.19451 Transcript_6936/m.19451 type:complete len:346 (-) Transcript_6936:1648-2685(-)